MSDGKEQFEQLIALMRSYHPSGDFSAIERAYETAAAAHANQRRKSGEPYIIHPMAVALILAELEMDRETIVAGILHDVIEDVKGFTVETLTKDFGSEVAQLVDGVTKLTNTDVQYKNHEEEQAANYRKMFLAISADIRVIIIKIADRLHNLRTLEYMSPEKQRSKAQESLDIYAPLAHRLGISKLRCEMEDLAFSYVLPDEYRALSEKVMKKQSDREGFIRTIVDELREKMAAAGIAAVVEGRPKHFFSIYKKMIGKDKDFDEIFDLFALRVIVESIPDCYAALGVVHEMYTPMPGRFKDYIAMPKQNGYQSLHTSLVRDGEPFEVQIRTAEMHKVAEYGVAAHWIYKEGGALRESARDAEMSEDDRSEAKLTWLREILDYQRNMSNSEEYLDAIKFDLNVYQHHVYIFTPKGQIVSLTVGATPIDYAYAIHSAIGNKMIGARVNGKMVPINTELVTGDRVEIITSQNSAGPSLDWLNIVQTSQARAKIRQWFKKENKQDNIQRGREALESAAKKKGVALSDLTKADYIKPVLHKYSLADWDAVCAAVGHGSVREGNIVNRLYEEYARAEHNAQLIEEARRLLEAPPDSGTKQQKTYKGGVIVTGYGAVEARFPKCCGPMPGDEIIAYVTRGRGVTVHRTDCANVMNMPSIERERIHEAEWAPHAGASTEGEFAVDLSITCDTVVKIPSDILNALSAEGAELRGLSRMAKREDVFTCGITVSSKAQYDKVKRRLKEIPYVAEVDRITS